MTHRKLCQNNNMILLLLQFRNTLYQSQQNIFLMSNTPMTQKALCQNTDMILFLNLSTSYLFQWIKTWIMQSNFSPDFYVSTYFANQLPGFSIGGTFGLRLVKNSDSDWKYRISLNKCPERNTLT